MKYQEDAELSELIKKQANRYQAPQNLRDRIVVALGEVKEPEAEHWTMRWLQWQQWLGMGAAFAFGVVLSIAVTMFYGMPGQQDRLAMQVVNGHVRSLMVAHLSDVESSDQHTVKPWFSGKLDYSPPVKDLATEGFPLIGGRLDYMDDRPVAALVYKHQLHTINVFVWPVRSKISSVYGSMSRQGFNVTSWRGDDGMQYWAVSDINSSDLQRFAELMRKQSTS
jgi:anti-sigma factor RsiW